MSLETNSFEFGEFRLDAKEKVLLRNGSPVSATPKTLQLLLALVENHGHIVEKNELMKAVWANSFVEEGNLSFTINLLRKILDDDAQKPRFVKTVPRRGYCFIAEVREIFPETKQNLQPVKISPSPRKFYAPFAALSVLLLLTLAAGSWMARKQFFAAASNAPILSAPFHSEKFSASGKVSQAAVSPDGKLVAFVDETAGKYGIWLRRLESSENIQLVSLSDDLYGGLAFARDGQTLFFMQKTRGENAQSAVYRVPIAGGASEKILEHAEGWISLSPDDRQISFVRCEYKDADFCSLLIADSDGRNERKILTRTRPIRITDNQFSPDGKRIAFAFGQSSNGGSDFHLAQIELETGRENEISPKTFFEVSNLKWLPGGELLLAAKENLDGKSKIWQVSMATGEAQPLTKDAASYLQISLSSDASRMIATQMSNGFHLYFAAGGDTKVLTAAREATFTPTGKIVYATDEGDIWTMNRDGGEQRQLTNNDLKDFSPRVAPDGCCVYFASNRSGTNQVWRMNIDGGSQKQLTKKEGGYPCFVSPDGRWIYYESGLHQTLWKIAADGGEEIQVAERKVYAAAFSSDGNFVAFYAREKDSRINITVMNVENQKILKTFVLADKKSLPVKIAWSNDNKTINYVIGNDSKNSLWQQSLDGDQPRFVTDLGDKEIEDFALAPDGSFAFTRGEWLHDAVLIDGLK